MAADYDRFSRQFKKSREFRFRTCIEEFMMLQMLGNLSGLMALDLACGEGHYARVIRRHGVARVIGVDISEGMIALAREEEAHEPLGVEYLKAGVEDLGVVGAFDVVSAVYLLHYAPTREHLAAMCESSPGTSGREGGSSPLTITLGLTHRWTCRGTAGSRRIRSRSKKAWRTGLPSCRNPTRSRSRTRSASLRPAAGGGASQLVEFKSGERLGLDDKGCEELRFDVAGVPEIECEFVIGLDLLGHRADVAEFHAELVVGARRPSCCGPGERRHRET